MFSLILLLFNLNLFAAINPTGGGNGGDVVVCPNSIELLDYYEARLFGAKIKQFTGVNEWEKAANILKPLATYNPTRFRLYNEGLKNFPKEMQFISGKPLEDIADQGDVPFSRDCTLKQIVVQMNAQYQENYYSWDRIQPKRYIIDTALWKRLDSNQRAGLIIHELILREAKNILNHDDSRMTRKLNAFWSTDYAHLSREAFNSVLRELSFGPVDLWVDQFIIFASPADYKEIFTTSGLTYQYYPKSYTLYEKRKLNIFTIVFDENVHPIRIDFSSSVAGDAFPWGKKEYKFFNTISFQGSYITGVIKENIEARLLNQPVHVTGKIKINKNGQIMEGVLTHEFDLGHENYFLRLQAGSYLQLKDDEHISYVTLASGAAKGKNSDYFKFKNAKIKFDFRNEVSEIEGGEVSGNIAIACLKNRTFDVFNAFQYTEGVKPMSIDKISPKLKCINQGKIYEVSGGVISLNCLIIYSHELLTDQLPCRLVE